MSDQPFIQTVSEENFERAVVQASFQRPVLVDFWADWCQPCKMLMPILTKLAEQYQGKFILAKVNTEEQRGLAAGLGIRSLPTVRLYINGQAVDEFMGALPEPQIRAFLDKHIPNENELAAQQAEQLLAQGQDQQALALIEQAAANDPDNALIQLTRLRITYACGELSQLEALLNNLPLELNNHPEVAAIRSQVALSTRLGNAADPEQLQQRLQADPNDSEARYQLAMYAVAEGRHEDALELLLELLRRDRNYGDDAARKGIVEIFNLLGGQGPLVSRYRNRLFTLLH